MRKLLVFVAASLVLALPSSSLAATTQVKINATAFSPKNVTITQGDTITWTNADKANRQLVADDGTFASPILKPGATYSFTFRTSGKVDYHDALKPTIKGSVTVKGPPPSVSLGAATPILVYGGSTTVSGTVSNANAGETVVITSRPYGTLTVQQVATVTTTAGGAFTYTVTPNVLTTYSAQWKTASSQTVTIQVRPKLSLLRSSVTKFYAKIQATPSFAGRLIYLQRFSPYGQWVTVGKYRLGPNDGRIFKIPHLRGTNTYRVYMTTNQAGAGYLETWSNSVKVRFKTTR